MASAPTPADLADRCEAALAELTTLGGSGAREGPGRRGDIGRLEAIAETLERSSRASRDLVRRLRAAAQGAQEFFDAMPFGFLFDPVRRIFSIGYRVTDGRLDSRRVRSPRLRGAARQFHRDRQG